MTAENNIPPNDKKEKPILEISGLHKSFGDNHVLCGVNLRLGEKENLVVLGRSGSGKSVLAKCIIGLVRGESGSIRVFGQDITGLSRRQLDAMRIRVGFVFQGSALYDSMTVKENLEFAMKRLAKHISRADMNRRVDEMLDNVSLPSTGNLMPSELSGGMKKRIALARTLVMKPSIMLYDEPTTGLDPVTSREISRLILDMQSKYGMSSVIITHDMSCARITANRMITLFNGIAYAEGTYSQLSLHSDPQVKAFFE